METGTNVSTHTDHMKDAGHMTPPVEPILSIGKQYKFPIGQSGLSIFRLTEFGVENWPESLKL